LRPDVLVAAARRFLLLLGGVSLVVVVGGLALAAFGAASPDRTVSLGFYGVGAFLVLGGFLLGNRGPYRSDSATGDRVGRSLRRATPDDTRDSVNMAVLLTVLGFLLLALGIIVDSRYKLV
jgi:hypothetical protein